MADEREGDVAPADLPRAFNRQSVGKRIAIVAAGPLANLVLAVLLFAGTYVAGVPGQRALLARVSAGGHACRAPAGVRDGDLVTAVDGAPVQELAGPALAAPARCPGAAMPTLTVERPDGSTATRIVSLPALGAADWEGNFMPRPGSHRRSRRRRSSTGDRRQAGRARGTQGRRSHRRDRRRSREFARRRSEPDQREARQLRSSSASRATAPNSMRRSPLKPSSRAGGASASPACASRSILTIAARLAVTVRYGIVDALAQGARKTWELSVVHAEDAGPRAHRRGVAQEHQRPDHDGRLRGPVGEGGDARVRRLSRAHQHQPRRAQSVARSASGWGAFAVLFRRIAEGQSRFRSRLRGRPAHRHRGAGGVDGAGVFQ